MTGIYKIENSKNGKVYVGQSLDIERRWNEHKYELNRKKHRNKYLQSAWSKYGEDAFDFNVLEVCNEKDLNDREIYWINYYRSYVGYDDCNGYNLTLGGYGTQYIHKVIQFDLSGNFICEWDNGYIASRKTGINPGTIYGCIVKRLKRAGKYIFCYKEDYNSFEDLSWYFDDRKTAPVLQFDLDGNMINKWDGCAEAIKDLGYNPINSLLGTTMTTHGYIFIYEDDIFKLTDEYLEYVRQAQEKIKNKIIYQLDNNCNIMNTYLSLNDVSRNGFSKNMVSDCCHHKRKNVKGYVFCFEDDYENYTPEICAKQCVNEDKRIPRNVLQFDMCGNLIHTYERLSHVESDGFLSSNVSNCCRGLIDHYKGYVWKYGQEVSKHNEKPVLQYDNKMNLICEYDSIKEASENTKLHASTISGNCNGRTKTAGGYIFRFKYND